MWSTPQPRRAPRLQLLRLEDRCNPSTPYLVTNLISDQAGVAPVTDPTLVNAWGIALNPGGAFWVSANGSDLSQVYTGDVAGSPIAQPFKVTIPGGAPTGQVFNNTGSATDFMITDGVTTAPAVFLFASEAGRITGWAPTVGGAPPSTTAETGFTSANGSVYKGVALAQVGAANFLYAADFHNNAIDVINGAFAKVPLGTGGFETFTDPGLPAGFAPFNVAAINRKLYVSYAKQDAAKHDDVAGAGNGFIDVFETNGHFDNRLVSGGDLNSPWGMVVAPTGFGDFSGDLIVGNFGDGLVHAYDPTTGAEKGFLADRSGNPVTVDGLWGLAFGNGKAGDATSLYFAAGPDGEAHGLFGKLTVSTPLPGTGGEGPGHDLVVVSGQQNGKAQVFALGADAKLTAQGSPLAPFGSFSGPVRGATADVDGDGIADTILVTGPGGPTQLAVISGKDGTTVLVSPMDPFGDAGFTGGAFVTAGDIDHDGRAEIVVTPDEGGGPRVVTFSLVGTTLTVRSNFFGIDDPAFRGGARAALGDVNGDGTLDLAVAAGFEGGPRVALFNGTTVLTSATPTKLVNDFFAFPGPDATTLRNGVFVTAGDFDGDGFADLAFGGGPGGGPRVLVVSGKTLTQTGIDAADGSPIANFFAFDGTQRGGVRLATKEGDGDTMRELVVGTGEGLSPEVKVYPGSTLRGGSPPGVSTTPFTDAAEPSGIFVG
jgi:uncharacterized protein (TIGR03118 family)